MVQADNVIQLFKNISVFYQIHDSSCFEAELTVVSRFLNERTIHFKLDLQFVFKLDFEPENQTTFVITNFQYEATLR